MFLEIIHSPVFIKKHRPIYFSKHSISEAGFCLRLQVKILNLGPIDRASPYLRTNDRMMDNMQQYLCIMK
jgi:hypothetical protein